MIVITGATGALNGATVEHLLKRIPADQVGVSVRDTAKAQGLADRGVRVRRGSYEDPAALLDSFEGADQVLLDEKIPEPHRFECDNRHDPPPYSPKNAHTSTHLDITLSRSGILNLS